MAQRRMLSKKVTDTDAFLDLPLSSQALYFHLNMHADDDGFVDNVNTIKRMVGASKDDEKLLIAKRFILQFEDSGIIVIKDWRLHNYIRKDTYNQTLYKDELSRLNIDENGSYQQSDCNKPILVNDTSTERPRVVTTGKDRLGKSNTMSSSNEHDLSVSAVSKKLIERINQLSGSKYRVTDKTKSMVKARLKDYTEIELMNMLDYVWKSWENWNERTKYFRPQTLFAPSKTDEYVAKMQAEPMEFENDADDWLSQITKDANNAL